MEQDMKKYLLLLGILALLFMGCPHDKPIEPDPYPISPLAPQNLEATIPNSGLIITPAVKYDTVTDSSGTTIDTINFLDSVYNPLILTDPSLILPNVLYTVKDFIITSTDSDGVITPIDTVDTLLPFIDSFVIQWTKPTENLQIWAYLLEFYLDNKATFKRDTAWGTWDTVVTDTFLVDEDSVVDASVDNIRLVLLTEAPIKSNSWTISKQKDPYSLKSSFSPDEFIEGRHIFEMRLIAVHLPTNLYIGTRLQFDQLDFDALDRNGYRGKEVSVRYEIEVVVSGNTANAVKYIKSMKKLN